MIPECKALFLDLSGVVWDGEELIEGAIETIEEARNRGLTLRFVTNTATRSSDELFRKCEKLKIPIEDGELFTAPTAARRYIERRGLHPYCLIHESIRPEFADLDGSEADCVLIGDARSDLHYESLNHAFRLCMDGAELIGIGLNRYFKDGEVLSLDAGPFIRAVEWAANVEAVIMGKPSRAFFDQVVASTEFAAGDCVMVGDDIEGDVLGAEEAGLHGVLVRTGKFSGGDEEKLTKGAEVIDSIAAIFS